MTPVWFRGEAFVPGRCHEWRGPRMGENRGYRCVECGARVENATEMADAPGCRIQMVPVSWLSKEERSRWQ